MLDSVDFNYCRLEGTLPFEFVSLPALTYLTAKGNHLSGEIPDSLSSVLSELYLDLNLFEGPMPCGSIGLMSGLQLLDFSGNSLSGRICSEFGLLQQLADLNIANNALDESLPSELATASALTGLFLNGNKINGPIPSQLGRLTGLQSLDLSKNQLSNTLPAELGMLSGLTYLSMGSNYFHGSVPSSFVGMQSLVNFKLQEASLSGKLPAAVMALPNLILFNIQGNKFTGSIPSFLNAGITEFNIAYSSLQGTIPESVCALKRIVKLTMSNNGLQGSIPACFAQFADINSMVLRGNNLQGTIPSLSLPNLRTLDLSNNQLTGQYPLTLLDSTGLEVLMLYNNRLGCAKKETCVAGVRASTMSAAASLPAALWRMPLLAQLNVGGNFFGGQLPADAGNSLPALTYIALNNNRFWGQLPSSLSRLSHLVNALFDGNAFSGTLPAFFFSMTDLAVLGLSDNRFYGSLSNGIAAMASLEELYLFRNQFTSTLPTSLSQLSQLRTLTIGYNSFTGSIPFSYGSMIALETFDISGCSLTGPIPSSFINLKYLQELLLKENSLTNKVGGWGFLDASLQKSLAVIDLSSNAFTGTIPTQWLTGSAQIQVFSLSANCLQGSLSPALCQAQALSALVLDGVTSGNTCKALFWGGSGGGGGGSSSSPSQSRTQFNGSYSLRTLTGSIPPCLFDLPRLETLHLAGNGLTGPIPNKALPPLLVDLTLSHNRLTSQAPPLLQSSLRQLKVCDLSYNRLSGTWTGDVSVDKDSGESTTLLSLHVNALSGSLPSSFQTAGNISVLDGNLWSCNAERSDLPQRDEYLDQFQCGSNVVNSAMISFVALGAATVLLGFALSKRRRVFRAKITAFLLATKEHHSPGAAASDARKLRHMGEDENEAVMNALHDDVAHHGGGGGGGGLALLLRHSDKIRIAVALGEMSRVASFSYWILGLILFMLMPIYAALSQYFGILAQMYAWAATAAYKKGEAPAGLLTALWAIVVTLSLLLITFQYFQSRFAFTKADDSRKARVNAQLEGYLGVALMARLVVIALGNIVAVLAAHYLYVWVLLNGTVAQQNVAVWGLSCFKMVWDATWLGWLPQHIRFGASEELLEEFNQVYGGGPLFMTLIKMFNDVAAPCFVTAFTDSTCFKNTLIAPPPITATYAYNFTSVWNVTLGGIAQSGVNTVLSQEETVFQPPYAYTFKCGSVLIQQYAPVFVTDSIQEACLAPIIELARRFARKAGLDKKPVEPVAVVDHFQDCVSDLVLIVTFGMLCPYVAATKCASMAVRTAMAQAMVVEYLETHEDVGDLDKEAAALEAAPLYQARWAFVFLPSIFLAFFATDMAGYHSEMPSSYIWAPVTMALLPAAFVLCCYGLALRYFPHFLERRHLFDSFDDRAMRGPGRAGEASDLYGKAQVVGQADSRFVMTRAMATARDPAKNHPLPQQQQQFWPGPESGGIEMGPPLRRASASLSQTSFEPQAGVGGPRQSLSRTSLPRLSIDGGGGGGGGGSSGGGDRQSHASALPLSVPWLPALPPAFAAAGSERARQTQGARRPSASEF